MGNAFTAVPGDSTSVSGNPAGIGGVKKLELTAFHGPLYLDVVFDSAHMVLPTRRRGYIGIGWLNIRAGDFEKRIDALDDYSTFSVYEQAGYLSYAYRIYPFLTAGISLKAVQHKVGSFSDTSFGSDIGVIVSIPYVKNFNVGYHAANVIAPRIRLEKTKEAYKLRQRIGFAYSLADMFKQYGSDITFAFDIEQQEYPDYRLSYGVEYGWNEIIFIRAGLDASDISTGLGVRMGNYQLDYAASAHDLGLVQKFSLTMRFGYSLAEMEMLRNKRYERVSRKDAKILSQSYTRIGLKYYDTKQYEKAITEWEKALIWNPRNKKAKKLQVEARGILDDLKRKKELDDHIILAHAYYSEKKWSESLDEWENVLHSDENNKEAQHYIKDIKDKIAISAQERENYKKLKSMTSKGMISKLNKEGWQYYQAGRYTRAIGSWKKIFEYEYENKTALDNISQANRAIAGEVKKRMEKGKTYYESNMTSKAMDEFNKVLRYEPGHPDATRYLELCRKQALEKKRREPPDLQHIDQLYFKSADLYLKGEYDRTLSVLDEILKQDPTNENALSLKEKTEAAITIVNGG